MSAIKKYFGLGFITGFSALPLLLVLVVTSFYALFKDDFTGFLEQQIGKGINEPNVPLIFEERADYDWKVRSVGEDAVIDLNSLKGKTLFINVWATWCMPCIAEMQYIQALYDAKKNEIQFLVVSEEPIETVKKFVARNSYTFPIYVVDGEIPKAFKKDVIPSTFIVSPSGKTVFSHLGAAKWDSFKFIKFLDVINAEF